MYRTALSDIMRSFRHGDKALFVQQSDEFHFSGKGLNGRQGERERTAPPEHLIPIFNAALNYLVHTIRASHEVPENQIKTALAL